MCPFVADVGGEVVDAADPKLAQLDDPIVGIELVTWDKDLGAGAKPARDLPPPKAPSAAALARHRLKHMPYCSRCPICVANTRPMTPQQAAS